MWIYILGIRSDPIEASREKNGGGKILFKIKKEKSNCEYRRKRRTTAFISEAGTLCNLLLSVRQTLNHFHFRVHSFRVNTCSQSLLRSRPWVCLTPNRGNTREKWKIKKEKKLQSNKENPRRWPWAVLIRSRSPGRGMRRGRSGGRWRNVEWTTTSGSSPHPARNPGSCSLCPEPEADFWFHSYRQTKESDSLQFWLGDQDLQYSNMKLQELLKYVNYIMEPLKQWGFFCLFF